jgi:hypothetical protein
MRQITVKHSGDQGTVTLAFTNAPHRTLQPGEEVVVWVDDQGRIHSPIGLQPPKPPSRDPGAS